MSATLLPNGFSDLEPFVADWSLDNERDRYVKLHRTDIEDLRVFYNAILPRIDDILDRLNPVQLDAYSEQEQMLLNLAMTFSETAHPIDLKWKGVDFNTALPWETLEFRSVSLPASER
jgi:hypothetical protein